MKKLSVLFLLVLLLETSCVSYQVKVQDGQPYGRFSEICDDVKYIKTESYTGKVVFNGDNYDVKKESFNYHYLLKKVRMANNDTTLNITNLIWDIKTTKFFRMTNSKNVGVTYDIIRCNSK
jgi:hypothetical protein